DLDGCAVRHGAERRTGDARRLGRGRLLVAAERRRRLRGARGEGEGSARGDGAQNLRVSHRGYLCGIRTGITTSGGALPLSTYMASAPCGPSGHMASRRLVELAADTTYS